MNQIEKIKLYFRVLLIKAKETNKLFKEKRTILVDLLSLKGIKLEIGLYASDNYKNIEFWDFLLYLNKIEEQCGSIEFLEEYMANKTLSLDLLKVLFNAKNVNQAKSIAKVYTNEVAQKAGINTSGALLISNCAYDKLALAILTDEDIVSSDKALDIVRILADFHKDWEAPEVWSIALLKANLNKKRLLLFLEKFNQCESIDQATKIKTIMMTSDIDTYDLTKLDDIGLSDGNDTEIKIPARSVLPIKRTRLRKGI